jgi:integrase/recombinase XerD
MPQATTAQRMTAAEMRRLCDAPASDTLLGLRDRALLATLASSGCRVAEVVRLTQAQIVDSLPIYIELPQGKQLVARQAPLSREAHDRIAVWLAARPMPAAYVFTRFGGRGATTRASAEPMSRTSAWRLVQRYAKQVGLAGVKPRDFRRFVGCELARRRGIRQAQRVLGHKRIETTAQQCMVAEPEGGITDGLY